MLVSLIFLGLPEISETKEPLKAVSSENLEDSRASEDLPEIDDSTCHIEYSWSRYTTHYFDDIVGTDCLFREPEHAPAPGNFIFDRWRNIDFEADFHNIRYLFRISANHDGFYRYDIDIVFFFASSSNAESRFYIFNHKDGSWELLDSEGDTGTSAGVPVSGNEPITAEHVDNDGFISLYLDAWSSSSVSLTNSGIYVKFDDATNYFQPNAKDDTAIIKSKYVNKGASIINSV